MDTTLFIAICIGFAVGYVCGTWNGILIERESSEDYEEATDDDTVLPQSLMEQEKRLAEAEGAF